MTLGLVAFTLPVFFVLVGFFRSGIYPFGDQSLLSMDLWGQYFPMYVEQWNNRRMLVPNLFSWNGALGFNAYVQNAYYSNSLLHWLFLLADKDNLIGALHMVTLLRIGLSSLSFYIFLQYRHSKPTGMAVAFSTAYALSAYTIAFIGQPMWMDAVILFPLVMLGLERLIFQKKPLLYTVMLALIIHANFYIGYAVCLFLAVAFILLLGVFWTELGEGNRWKAALRFVVFSALSGGLAGFVLIPVLFSLRETAASSLGGPQSLWLYHSFPEYLSKLLPATPVSLAYGIPNIFSGTVVLILVPLFFANRKIPGKVKAAFLGLLVVLYFSMNLNILNYVWHGFHFPNQLPGRWTFMVSFVLLAGSFETLMRREGISETGAIIALFNVIFVLSILKVLPPESRGSDQVMHVTMFVVTLLTFLILQSVSVRKEAFRKIALVLVGLVVVADVGINAAFLIDRDVPTSSISFYQRADQVMADIVSEYESGDQDFYRMEMFPPWTFNPGQLYRFKGVGYYSSTMSEKAFRFFEQMGFRVYAQNVSTVYDPYSPVSNALFSIRYLIDPTSELDVPGFINVGSLNEYGVLENSYDLPVAFMVNNGVLGYEADPEEKPFGRQNRFFNAIAGREVNVFELIDLTLISVSNASVDQDGNWKNQLYYRTNPDQPVVFRFIHENDREQDIFIQHNFKAGDLTLHVNDQQRVFRRDHTQHGYLGHFDAGDEIVLTLTAHDVEVGLWGLDLFSFNEQALSEAHLSLSTGAMDITGTGPATLSGTIQVADEGVLFTSVPGASGWRATINGEQVPTALIAGYLMGIELPAGDHVVEFTYRVPGMLPGILLSLFSLGIVTGNWVIEKKPCPAKKLLLNAAFRKKRSPEN